MTPSLPKAIADGKFAIVGYGESYQAKIVSGDELYPTMMELMYSTNWKEDASPEVQQSYWNELCDIDNHWWCCDDVPSMWDQAIGETDHIQIIRITE